MELPMHSDLSSLALKEFTVFYPKCMQIIHKVEIYIFNFNFIFLFIQSSKKNKKYLSVIDSNRNVKKWIRLIFYKKIY